MSSMTIQRTEPIAKKRSDCWLVETANTVLAGWIKGQPAGESFKLDHFYVELGRVARMARLGLNLTQHAFAVALSKHLGRQDCPITQSYVATMESRCAATLDRFQVIAAILNLTPAALVVAAEAAALCSGVNPAQTPAMLEELVGEIRAGLKSKERTPDERKIIRTWLAPAALENTNLLAEAVGAAIKSYRIRGGFSQQALTKQIARRFASKITPASLSQSENGHAPSSWNRLAQISAVLDVSFGDLFLEAERASLHFDVSLKDQLDKLSDLSAKASALQTQDEPLTDADRALVAELALQMLSTRRQISIFTKKRPKKPLAS